MNHQGRVAIVTGGTRGIGEAITRMLAAAGAHVAAAYAGNHDRARALVQDLRDSPGSVSVHPGDVGDRAFCHRLVDEVLAAHGRVDYVVNNAGLLVENSFGKMTEDEWDQAVAVNLSGPFHLSQAALAPMLDAGYGRVVHVGSITALLGNRAEIGYGAAKAGLIGLTRSMARATARKGITVNLVVPGVFDTDMTRAMRPEDQAAIAATIPIGRRGDPAELAHAVGFLLDEKAAYMTGSVVTVDGGISMGG
ncbi:MAG TPA: SDR family oxidoreductase [Mycobacteriales bacterium]|nr:SDR family oxidoreductase [Mycobacteriales bacterium]